jgi:hypothetical protein
VKRAFLSALLVVGRPGRVLHASVRVALLAALLLVVTPARSDTTDPSCDKTCSVNRNCSSTGVVCLPDDRACADRARSSNLEVKCEQQCDSGVRFVYCPPDTGRSDSKYVWVFLAFAIGLAAVGAPLAWLVLRKKEEP